MQTRKYLGVLIDPIRKVCYTPLRKDRRIQLHVLSNSLEQQSYCSLFKSILNFLKGFTFLSRICYPTYGCDFVDMCTSATPPRPDHCPVSFQVAADLGTDKSLPWAGSGRIRTQDCRICCIDIELPRLPKI